MQSRNKRLQPLKTDPGQQIIGKKYESNTKYTEQSQSKEKHYTTEENNNFLKNGTLNKKGIPDTFYSLVGSTEEQQQKQNTASTEIKQYYGGETPYTTIIKMRNLSYEDKINNYFFSVEVLDQHGLIFHNKQEPVGSRRISQLTKEKVMDFDWTFQDCDNEMVYKTSFNKVIKDLINGINQSILVYGGRNSGKSTVLFGSLRDIGFLHLVLRELFNELQKKDEYEQIVVKLSFSHYANGGFQDLLINTKRNLSLYEDDINEVFLLGLSEIIVNNMRTALKLVKLALLNLQNFEQNPEKCKSILKNCNFSMSIKLEIPFQEQIKTGVKISKLKLFKFGNEFFNDIISTSFIHPQFQNNNQQLEEQGDESSMVTFSNCIRIMSEINMKTRKTHLVPYTNNHITEMLRDSLGWNSKTYFLCCMSSLDQEYMDTANSLRIANFAKFVTTSPHQISFSFSYSQTIYLDIKVNMIDTINIWLNEFESDTKDPLKKKRMLEVFDNLNKIEQTLMKIIEAYDFFGRLQSALNSLCAQLLAMGCQAYSKSITSDDIKEFYIAKLQKYTIDHMQNEFKAVQSSLVGTIDSLYEQKQEISSLQKQLQQNFRILEIKEKEKKMSSLNNFDIEKFTSLGKLAGKLMEIYDLYLGQCSFSQLDAALEIHNIFSKINNLHESLQEEGVIQEESHQDAISQVGQKAMTNTSLNSQKYQKQKTRTLNLQQKINTLQTDNLVNQEQQQQFIQQDQQLQQQYEIDFKQLQKNDSQLDSQENIGLSRNEQDDSLDINQIEQQQQQQLMHQNQEDKIIQSQLKDAFIDGVSKKCKYLYINNNKINTGGKYELKSIKRQYKWQERQGTSSSGGGCGKLMVQDESGFIDEDLMNGLFKNEKWKMESLFMHSQQSTRKMNYHTVNPRISSVDKLVQRKYPMLSQSSPNNQFKLPNLESFLSSKSCSKFLYKPNEIQIVRDRQLNK